MIVFDLFAGTRSSTQAFEDAGHDVLSFDNEPSFECTETVDVTTLQARDLIAKYGKPDFIWASPPCTAFSVASMGHHWVRGGGHPLPRTKAAQNAQEVVSYTIALIKELNPIYGFLIENPRGMLRKLPVVAHLPRRTVSYCTYGDTRMKPTDLWGVVNSTWQPRVMCKNGSPCHVAAPRGSKTGTQGLKGAKDRSRVPYQLGLDILESLA